MVTAVGEDCPGLDVSVSDFTHGRDGIPAANVTIYRQEFLNIFYRSSEQGELGEWPDPLIPKVDPDYGEVRNAFPYDVRCISHAYKRYPIRGGRSFLGLRGTGELLTGGHYTGGLASRFVIRIVSPGPIGDATFAWWSEPGSLQSSGPIFTSAGPVRLAQGVTVKFRGAGGADDFRAGDEFWFFTGPERHQPVWVDVQVPEGAAPGIYTGQVMVTAGATTRLALPVKIEVLPFTLPRTNTLASQFGIDARAVYAAHYRAEPEERKHLELFQAYARAALRNSVTLDAARDFAPVYRFRADGSIAKANYSQYDRAVETFMDGRGTQRGARWTSLRLPRFEHLNKTEFRSAVHDFVRHVKERGWSERLFDFLFDEPRSPEDFRALRERAVLLREVEPQIARLSTTALDASLSGLVTRWCPIVNSFEPQADSLREWWHDLWRPRRRDYDARLRMGDSLWWYQSCRSHGCGIVGQSPEYDN